MLSHSTYLDSKILWLDPIPRIVRFHSPISILISIIILTLLWLDYSPASKFPIMFQFAPLMPTIIIYSSILSGLSHSPTLCPSIVFQIIFQISPLHDKFMMNHH